MAALHAAAVAVALTTLAASPILIAWLVVRADDLAGYADDVIERLPGPLGHEPTARHRPIEDIAADLRRLAAELRAPVLIPAELAELEQDEREAVELDRLARQLEGMEQGIEPAEVATPSAETLRRAAQWRAELRREAVWISYDEALRDACRALGVPHHLDTVVGVELAAERIRVEEDLIEAGLRVR
ncbi:hypothetical protein [Longispora albida]|uniref:hypothetical protein n=1 Tax=Longispora albida TaxID=203523 RepID=UPI00036EFAF9|nr:hypothetical protein [Longispora albida]